jgi:hypothetical protein
MRSSSFGWPDGARGAFRRTARVHTLSLPAIALDRRHRLAGQPRKGADLSFQGKPLGREVPVLEGVPVALGAPPLGPCIWQTLVKV